MKLNNIVSVYPTNNKLENNILDRTTLKKDSIKELSDKRNIQTQNSSLIYTIIKKTKGGIAIVLFRKPSLDIYA